MNKEKLFFLRLNRNIPDDRHIPRLCGLIHFFAEIGGAQANEICRDTVQGAIGKFLNAVGPSLVKEKESINASALMLLYLIAAGMN